jgi:hypothetical protein
MSEPNNLVEIVNNLILRLKDRLYVPKKELVKVLSKEQIDYLYSLTPDALQPKLRNSKKVLQPYDVMLKKAAYKYGAATRSAFNMKKLIQESDTLFELALEKLDEMVGETPSIVLSLDRQVVVKEKGIDFSASDISLGIEGVPRHIDSSSQYTKKRSTIKSLRMENAMSLLKNIRDELLNPSPIQEPEEITCFQKNKKKLNVNIDDWRF